MDGAPARGSVLVIGSGIAGTAAALAGATAGARTRLILGTSGATTLSSGAIDEVPWEQMAPRMRPISEHEQSVLAQIDLYALRAEGSLVATMAGTVRRARGTDRAILDLNQIVAYFNYVNRIADGLGVRLEAAITDPGQHAAP